MVCGKRECIVFSTYVDDVVTMDLKNLLILCTFVRVLNKKVKAITVYVTFWW